MPSFIIRDLASKGSVLGCYATCYYAFLSFFGEASWPVLARFHDCCSREECHCRAFASIFESMHVAPRKRLFEATSFCIMISVIVGLILPIFVLFLDSFFISRQRVTSIRTPPQVFLILCLQAPGTLVHSAIAF